MPIIPVALDDCNCMVRYGDKSPADWFPSIKRDGKFFDPSGTLVSNPTEYKIMTADEIKNYMATNGIESVRMT